MNFEIAISYKRAKEMQQEGNTRAVTLAIKAWKRGIYHELTQSTTKAILGQWRAGTVDLIISTENWK